MFSALWRGWLITARKIGYVQSWIILALIYFLVLAPFALVIRLFHDPLNLGRRGSWQWFSENERPTLSLDWVKRQF